MRIQSAAHVVQTYKKTKALKSIVPIRPAIKKRKGPKEEGKGQIIDVYI